MEEVIINGQKGFILYNHSHAKSFDIGKATLKTIELIDLFLEGNKSTFKWPKGITTMASINTLEGFKLENTRISNDVGILRQNMPPNTVFTYQLKDEKMPRYAVAKTEKNKLLLESLKAKILLRLDAKNEA